MARKPQPKPPTQRELAVEKQIPYAAANLGNPNDRSQLNRGNQISQEGDGVKPFTLGIQDIDESIKYYIDNVVQPFVYQNGERINVPVIYGNPEKWKAVQNDGYYRDKNGKIMAPLMMFKRENLERARNLPNKMDANFPNLYQTYITTYDKNNQYSNFDVLNNRKPVKTQHVSVMPDYVNVTYSCTIMTYYMEQMNKIVEAMNYASDTYWGDPQRFKFQAIVGAFNNVTEANISGERIVKTTFQIKLLGHLVPDIIQRDLTGVKKVNTVGQLIVTSETVSKLP